MASDGKLKDFGSGLTRCFWIGYLKALPFPLKKIDHSVFHILLAPQQSPGLLFQYPEIISLPAKGDDAAVIVKAEHRFEEKNASFLSHRSVAQLKERADVGANNLSQQISLFHRQFIKQVVLKPTSPRHFVDWLEEEFCLRLLDHRLVLFMNHFSVKFPKLSKHCLVFFI